jgi:hypothetical protein
MGAVMRAAVKGGYIDPTDRTVTQSRTRTARGDVAHTTFIRVYVSTFDLERPRDHADLWPPR